MSQSPNKGTVVVMAGGTGGHIFPALATANLFKDKGYQVHWLGTENSMEAELIPKYNLPISLIPIKGIRGKGVMGLIKAPVRLIRSIWQARKLFKQLKPVCVLGMGGFVTGPGGVAAKLLGIPLVIHEQNAIPGLTNQLLAKVANRVLEAFPGTFQSQQKVFCTGNPVRSEIVNVDNSKQSQQLLKLLVVGGSLGAKAINDIMPAVVKSCVKQGVSLELWHQTGKQHFTEVKTAYQAENFPNIKVEPFIADMAAAYQWADLVLCRAGALTISELASAGVAALLVPYPFAVDDHQTKNAEFLVRNEAAVLMPQSTLTVDKLVDMLIDFSKSPEKLVAMATNAHQLAEPAATDKVVQHCLEISYG
ncbi:undecaprenyldiphospho-muramoylpentapeptide beta-N-acetylglucosaminyltransferase [Endozoicomonas sp. SM1973]|uniref:UDP-N-acetylglucosamine--N-acetylmuramyl-(pentapeptide) pyrophosphoryl-undecaprenol N-acetylglucosamine transferase n=1 Tax=Spartinivicinus marinus TaxID=2994442 RepID=A0A853HV64_9GAMM|nr:undecaprenyldiphospho-muramoylpentapeptide beta-N-acetylglucosaminyltransferase [Spartinivicinus marinus]MCX4028315.1 undecaprenyldiphospho-muramoylpentapeptide beta-N-acetylglucosaminyltransferase [Spartinivicinus marinus]NYZ65650.1 undecaprenyldiphospho-muramoylpentapeptide beta-N-acetylglucosaminyltransferase [Spartinivicinus marinus]